MFKLKSKKLEREFNVTDGYLYASQIKTHIQAWYSYLTEAAVNLR